MPKVKKLAAEYKCPAKQSSTILPCPVITDTKSAPFPSSSRLALTFYVQQTWKKTLSICYYEWIQFFCLKVLYSMSLLSISSPPPSSPCHDQWWYCPDQYHHHHGLYHHDNYHHHFMNTDFVEYTLLHFSSWKISPDRILIAFILLKQTNKKPKAQKKKVIFLRVYLKSITEQALQSKFSFHLSQ